MAEHVTTGHKVAIKILNKKKIKHMDMEEKGIHLLLLQMSLAFAARLVSRAAT